MTPSEWQTEDDLRILLRAEEIMGDKARMAAVRRLAEAQLARLGELVAHECQGRVRGMADEHFTKLMSVTTGQETT